MKSLQGILMTGLLAAGTLGVTGVAQARSDVYWSVGVGSPGVAIGVGNLPPPVYVAPQPVYVAPPPAYYAPPHVVYRPAPRHYWGDGHHHYKHRRHHRHGRDWD